MSDLLWEGLNLALFGMGFVFIFLIVLVFLTGAMSSLVRQFSPLTVGVDGSNQTSNRQSDRKAANKKRQGSDSQLGTDENNEVVAAVTAAVRLHHSKR
ncbi:hypothetical protein GCM10011403_14130 [Pseudohongiella nitratireducens]|jgi:oxaloacetate decarboxylase gamma subunit|uniref:Oxaloacetate decarboxylase gamma chain n=1 Tax=Pseudohongiella nitratireducens TaxID=1768907 RepID=A0A917GVJ3_9GAMM|nr:OadG family transporter subunit [Pseudohongiella nitratireducens]GGG57990.1 hypothetical protein GCM10011403_14130 [Pseudohongiella nitratireducens]|tara:strand:- start:29040 stop:29333 length:294 start_codon:yes stop_codon:yes gene_type:complete